jgi:hypothetical protein
MALRRPRAGTDTQPDEQLVERLTWLLGKGFRLGFQTAEWLLWRTGGRPRALGLCLAAMQRAAEERPDIQTACSLCLAAESIMPLSLLAAEKGRLGCQQLLHARGFLAARNVTLGALLAAAARKQRGQVALWLASKLLQQPLAGKAAATEHVAGGTLADRVVQRRQFAAELSADLFAEAAHVGSVPLLQLLRQHGCGWDACVWRFAATSGCVELIE